MPSTPCARSTALLRDKHELNPVFVALPATSILLAKKTRAQITGRDKDIKSVKQSKSLLANLGLTDIIKIEHSDAVDYNINNFDIVIVSQGIKPNRIALEHISKSMNPNARIIFRTTSTINGELVKKDVFLKDIFSIKKIIPQKTNGLLISVLLLKK